MSTRRRNRRNQHSKERGLEELVSRIGAGLTAGPPPEGGLCSLLEFDGGLRTRCAPHARTALAGVVTARHLAGRMVVTQLEEHSPYEEEALDDAFAELGVAR